jgi:hypothetical protein
MLSSSSPETHKYDLFPFSVIFLFLSFERFFAFIFHLPGFFYSFLSNAEEVARLGLRQKAEAKEGE